MIIELWLLNPSAVLALEMLALQPATPGKGNPASPLQVQQNSIDFAAPCSTSKMVSCVVYGPRKGDAEQKTAQCFYQNYTQGVYFAHKKPFHFLCCHCRIFALLEESLHFLQYVGGNKQLHLGE